MKRSILIMLAAIVAVVLSGCGAMAPHADAGEDQTVNLGDTVTLSAADSDRKNGDALSYRWTITKKPSGSTEPLINPNTATPTFTPDELGDYTFELVVDNDYHESESATVKITCIAPGEAIPEEFATDPSELVTLYDLAAEERSRDAEMVNFRLTFTLENKGDINVDIDLRIFGLDADGNEVAPYEINAVLESGEIRISNLAFELAIAKYDSIEAWEADPITISEEAPL